jgi:hypothetical protein
MKEKKIRRRNFFATSIGASVATGAHLLGAMAKSEGAKSNSWLEGTSNDYEQFFANGRHWEALGRPHDWSIVREGLHPFSPERVIVIPDDTRHQLIGHSLEEARASVIEHYLERPSSRDEEFVNKLRKQCETEQGTTCIQIMKVISDHYKVPEVFLDWASRLLFRDSRSTTGLTNHIGFVHEYQWNTPVKVKNPPVDWWLIQIPGGMDFKSLDEQPVHLLGGTVLSTPGGMVLGNSMGAIERLLFSFDKADIVAISRMDRLSVCRHLNSKIPEALADYLS